uniref:Uncharacterized protein n=1 Tax=Anguilla anguilla TaxID=7936 RepID=A0A0E9VVU6_ANGAN
MAGNGMMNPARKRKLLCATRVSV